MTYEERAALEQATHEFSKDWDFPPGWAATGKAFALFGAIKYLLISRNTINFTS